MADRRIKATDIVSNTHISLIDQVKIQAQVLIPLLRALRAELGEERANRIVAQALREWAQELYRGIAAAIPGTPRQKWEAMMDATRQKIAGAIEVERLKQEAEALEFNITSCPYADFFRELDEPELGALLLCEQDFHVAEAVGPDVELTRTQTIMKGAQYCDFHYRMKKAVGPKVM